MKRVNQLLFSLITFHLFVINADEGTISIDGPLANAGMGMRELNAQNENGTDSEECSTKERPYKIELRNIENRGVGYEEGYTTLEWYYMPTCGNFTPILDIRGHVFNNGKFASNVGVGLRYLNSMIWGINAYYDFRQTHRTHFNQISVGLEALGRWLDYRINGYFPVGKRHSGYYDTDFDEFKGNNIILRRKKEFAMTGANAEIGVHILDRKNVDLYTALGPYYFGGEGKNAWGGEARLAATFFDHLRVQASTSYDSVFKWIGQGEVGVVFSFGPKKKLKKLSNRTCSEAQYMAERAVQRIDRNEIIVVDRKKKKSKAINPLTGEPYFVVFVDNTSSSDGTFESPFSTLTTAENHSKVNDIIYVFPGDGTSKGMDQGITLQDGQKLIGSGAAAPINTQFGIVDIPALSSNFPQLSVPGATVIVTSGNNTYISGLMMTAPGGIGVEGINVSNITVDSIVFVSTVAHAGGGAGIGGTGENLTVTNSTFVNCGFGAAYSAATGTLIAKGNRIIDTDFGISSQANAALIKDNTITGGFLGIQQSLTGPSNISIINNNVSAATFQSIQIGSVIPQEVCLNLINNVTDKKIVMDKLILKDGCNAITGN